MRFQIRITSSYNVLAVGIHNDAFRIDLYFNLYFNLC